MVSISTEMAMADASSRLNDLLGSETKQVAGSAAGAHITVIRTQRYGNSILRPAFSGTLESTENGCVLRGRFELLKSARVFMGGWFVIAIAWVIATTFLFVRFHQPFGWLLPTVGLLVLLFGVLLLKFARRYYRSDRDWIVDTIKEEIRGTVTYS